MSTPSTLAARLRESVAEFQDLYAKHQGQGVFGGLYTEVPASQGFFKLTGMGLPGEMEAFTGTAIVNGADSASQSYTVTDYHYTAGIDINLLSATDAISRGQVSRLLQGMVGKAVGQVDKLLTNLLLTGESVGGLQSGAFYSTTVAMPGSATFSNMTATSTSGSAAEVRAAIRDAQRKFMSMRNVGNDAFNAGRMPRIAVMYPALGDNGGPIHQFVHDAINPDILNDAAKFEPGSVVAIANPYIASSNDDIWFFDLDTMQKALVVGWQERPKLISTIGHDDSYKILYHQDLFQVKMTVGVSFGSQFASVMGNDA